MARDQKLTRLLGVLAIVVASCGADDNMISTDGPIPNPAIDAGATQAQGAPSADGPTAQSLENEELSIELDGETIEIEDLENLEPIDEALISGLVSLSDCRAILTAPPSVDVDRCSYDPSASEVIVDQLAPGRCENGMTYLTLNRPDGSGAFVGVVGEAWVELGEEVLSLQSVEVICEVASR